MKQPYLEGRICYCADLYGDGEHFVFQSKWSNEPDTMWSLECAFPFVEYKNGELIIGSGDLLNFQAVTKIREWMKLGVKFHFGKDLVMGRKEDDT